MVTRTAVLGVLGIGLFLTGCISPGIPMDPLVRKKTFEFKYSGAIAPGPGCPIDETPAWARLMSGDEEARSETGPAVPVSFCFFRMDRDVAQHWLPVSRIGAEVVSVDGNRAEALLTALEKRGDVVVMGKPALSALNGQAGQVSMLSRISYVDSFDLKAAPGARIADPRVRAIEHGLVVTVLPEVATDTKSIEAALSLLQVNLVKPMVLACLNESGARLSLEVPILVRQRIETRVTVAEGEAILVAGLSAEDPSEMVLAFMYGARTKSAE